MICKIWGIKANKKNIKAGVRNTLSYLKDEEKTRSQEDFTPGVDDFAPFDTLMRDNSAAERDDFASDEENNFARELEFVNTEEDISNVLNYFRNENKTRLAYISGYMCSPDTAVEEFYLAKETNLTFVGATIDDDTGNQAFHIVQSFPDDLDISDDEVHECGIDLVRKLAKYQAVITSHIHPVIDENGVMHGKCKHNHILINSHIHPDYIDPLHPERMKYHDCRDSYLMLQQLNDEVALEHGLPIIESSRAGRGYSWFDIEMNNKGKSWKQRVRVDIETNMQLAGSWEEFCSLMRKAGYQIHEGKHETYTTPEKQKVRGSTLGEEYTREYMESYWSFREDLERSINTEIESNTSPLPTISFRTLVQLLTNKEDNLYIRIPRINRNTRKNYDMYLMFGTGQNEKTLNIYINDDSSYAFYRDKKEYLGLVNGKAAKTAMLGQEYISYEEQRKWEELENQQTEQEDLKRILARRRSEYQFSKQGWNNTKTGRPYHVGLYDEYGNKRTLLEQLLILAIVVITNEAPDYLLSEKERMKQAKAESALSMAAQKPSWKIEKLTEAIKLSKEENIENLSQLAEEINATGKKISMVKAKQRKNLAVREKLEPIHRLLDASPGASSLDDMPPDSKEMLKYYGIESQDKVDDFVNRWEYNLHLEADLNRKMDELSRRYTKLKKIKYQADLATDRQYCYGKGGRLV